MTGEKVRELLKDRKIQQKEIASKLGMSTSNLGNQLDKEDIRTGLLEKIAEAAGIPIAEFYGDSFGTPVAVSDTAALELLKMKDEQLSEAMQQVTTAQGQTSEVLAQMREVIEILKHQAQPVNIPIIQPTSSPVTPTGDYTHVAKRDRRPGMITAGKAKKLTNKPKIG